MPFISTCWTQTSLVPNSRNKSKKQELKFGETVDINVHWRACLVPRALWLNSKACAYLVLVRKHDATIELCPIFSYRVYSIKRYTFRY